MFCFHVEAPLDKWHDSVPVGPKENNIYIFQNEHDLIHRPNESYKLVGEYIYPFAKCFLNYLFSGMTRLCRARRYIWTIVEKFRFLPCQVTNCVLLRSVNSTLLMQYFIPTGPFVACPNCSHPRIGVSHRKRWISVDSWNVFMQHTYRSCHLSTQRYTLLHNIYKISRCAVFTFRPATDISAFVQFSIDWTGLLHRIFLSILK